MFASLLVANRGEIACRIIGTAHRLGLSTIAVVSEADRDARHARLADRVVEIGPAPAAASYLNIDALIAAALEAGAEAIHPGYGFLSENAKFAEACHAAGLVFVGPPAEAIRAMGSKSEAKRIMGEAGVPLVPGYHGEDQDLATFEAAAAKIGYPVMIKASDGGGGKGMRAVASADELADAVDSARREAAAAFGGDRLLVEKLIERPRHIEIQIFADRHGHTVHLFERDCSIQRRHQKVIEEAPAPGMSDKRRAEMGAAAVAVAEAIGYVGAGTVEFIVEPAGGFYFLEMNTRLQVEHPVSEMITGHDLVEWQLRVAAGEALPAAQNELSVTGHAIEARLYAEDPGRDFLPAAGRLTHLRFPDPSTGARVDTGFEAGDAVSVHYDPMIAKIIVHAPNRDCAVAALGRALGATQATGLATNRDFLAAIAAHPAFAAGEVDTGFIERHREALTPPPAPATNRALALTCAGLFLGLERRAALAAALSSEPNSPWHRTDGWRLNDDAHHEVCLADALADRVCALSHRGGEFQVELPDASEIIVNARVTGQVGAALDFVAEIDGQRSTVTLVREDDAREDGARALVLFDRGAATALVLHDPRTEAAVAETGGGRVLAPMPGTVIAVLVTEGERVEAGAPLVILEAMKMEHTLSAPGPGRVARIDFAPGAQVEDGAELLVIEAED